MYEPVYHGYSARPAGRLPSIHAIGKAKPVDEEEPPDVPCHMYGYEMEMDQSFSSVESVFDPSDAEDACKLLRKAFHLLGPGRHACKRNPDHGGSHFVHCRRGVKLGGYYSQLRRLLEERAGLELLRDCLYRVRSAQLFVEELEALLSAEYRTAYAIRHGCLLDAPVSKLYCLNALCEDLRVHAGHWNSVKQRINTGRWAQPLLGFFCRELAAVRRTLGALCDRAIFLMDRLVHVGFEVLAHCALDALTADVLWNITRGLEDFNTIVASFRAHVVAEGVYSPQSSFAARHLPSLYLHPALANAGGRLSDGIRAVPFHKVLGILANERSRYAAQLTHRFFTTSDAFLAALRTAAHLPPFEWEDDPVSSVSGVHLHSRFSSSPPPAAVGGAVGGSQASLNLALLHVGSVRVPDLSGLPSPLVEFSQKEQQFADNFLQIVCNSTSLLRKNEATSNNNQQHNHHHGRSKAKARTDFKVPLSPVVARPPKSQGETPVLSRSDSRRKTVSWGDNADTSIRTQVVATYMGSLWQHFGRNLDLFLDEPAWTNRVGLLRSELGSIFLQRDTVCAMLRHMVEHICVKDIFPSGSISPLLGVVVRLHALSAFAAWDSNMTAASSSQQTDKCIPCHAGESQYSTRSGRLLREAYRPLLTLLLEMCRNMRQVHAESADLMPPYDLDLSLVSSVVARVLVTCQAAFAWLASKLHHFLSSWNVKMYIFFACTDVKILADSSRRATHLLQTLVSNQATSSSSLLDQLVLAHLNETLQQINSVSTQIQGLEESAVKLFAEKFNQRCSSFFQDVLPPAKYWRRKVPPEFPEDASSYVLQVWENVLQPVVEGISKLPVVLQLTVLTAAITALSGAWTSLFLKDKIKFSLYGAQQLGVDFDHLRTSLSNALTLPEARRGLLELSVFRQMNGIVQLLKRQPLRRPSSRFRDCSTEDLSCESGEVNASPSASRSELPANMEEVQESNDVCFVTNMDDWLALRVIGGSRSWRFPSCFGTSAGQR